jgi:hypothetical protein
MGTRLLSESPTLSVADRRCLLLFELSYRGTKSPLIDRPCDEDKRARADRAAGTLVLVGLLEIGMGLYTEKQQSFLSIHAGFSHVGLCDVAQLLPSSGFSSGFAESRKHALLEEDNRNSPVNLKSRSPLWDDLHRAQSHRGGVTFLHSQ